VDIDLVISLSGDSLISPELLAELSLESQVQGNSSLVGSVVVDLGYPAPVRYQPPCRLAPSGRLVLEQVDLFLADGKTRAQDVTQADLQLRVFLNGTQVDWPLVSGQGVQDTRVTAGRVYWTEFSAGFYDIRFFPNRVGTWRVVLTYPAHDQAISLSYDVAPQYQSTPSGMSTSFFRR